MGVCRRLLPLATVGDGNCLLHAASLGMWGFHDRLLTLRKALYCTLTSHLAKGAIKRRWRLQQWEKNIEAGGLLYSEEEWEKEWQEVLRIASTQRRLAYEQKVAENRKGGETVATLATIAEKDGDDMSEVTAKEEPASKVNQSGTGEAVEVKDDYEHQSEASAQDGPKEKETEETEAEGGAFESLEDIHVFVLAHVLRRPIIIIADQFLYGFGGEPIAPIPFGGVYLPLECDPSTCLKSPLVLAFDSAHFSPLVPSDEKKDTKNSSLKASVPLVGPNYELLPIQFSVDPGEDFLWSSLDGDSSIVDDLALSMDKKLALLKKYLNVDLIKIPSTSKKDSSEDSKSAVKGEKSSEAGSASDSATKPEKKLPSKSVEKKEKSWIATQIMKVGTMAGVVGGVVHSDIYVAKLQTDKKPDYYDEMMENYIESAKLRFEEEKKSQAKATNSSGNTGEKPQPCINPGCHLYGTSATNYLCSGCYKTQKSYSETGRYLDGSASTSGRSSLSNYDNSGLPSYLPPPSYSAYVPYGYFGDRRTQSYNTTTVDQRTAHSSRDAQSGLPSYDEVMDLSKSTASSLPFGSFVKLDSTGESSAQGHSTTGQSVVKCVSKDCQFFGSPGNKGYCSACYKTYKKSLKYMVEENEASKSKVV